MKLVVITGTCGAGKSTVKDEIERHLDACQYVCIDTDEVGINWWDYAGTDYEHRYSDDCLKEALLYCVRPTRRLNNVFVRD